MYSFAIQFNINCAFVYTQQNNLANWRRFLCANGGNEHRECCVCVCAWQRSNVRTSVDHIRSSFSRSLRVSCATESNDVFFSLFFLALIKSCGSRDYNNTPAHTYKPNDTASHHFDQLNAHRCGSIQLQLHTNTHKHARTPSSSLLYFGISFRSPCSYI